MLWALFFIFCLSVSALGLLSSMPVVSSHLLLALKAVHLLYHNYCTPCALVSECMRLKHALRLVTPSCNFNFNRSMHPSSRISRSTLCSEISLSTGALIVQLSFSRYLDNNQLTMLPEGLLSTTTQLQQL